MGKYDKVLAGGGQSEATLTPQEAVAAIVLVAMSANNEAGEDEAEYLNDVLSSLEIFDSYSAEQMQEMIDKLTAIIEEEGIGVLFNTAVASMSDEYVETAFEVAIEAVLVDEELSEEEEEFINKLQQALGIPEEVAQEILDDLVGV